MTQGKITVSNPPHGFVEPGWLYFKQQFWDYVSNFLLYLQWLGYVVLFIALSSAMAVYLGWLWSLGARLG